MQRIKRQKAIEGTRIPGIIKNGQYYYINLDVYEDGMINCWELVDIKGLEEKLRITEGVLHKCINCIEIAPGAI